MCFCHIFFHLIGLLTVFQFMLFKWSGQKLLLRFLFFDLLFFSFLVCSFLSSLVQISFKQTIDFAVVS